MTRYKRKKRKCKNAFKNLRLDLKKCILLLSEELLLPQPDAVKSLMYKMDELLKVIESK